VNQDDEPRSVIGWIAGAVALVVLAGAAYLIWNRTRPPAQAEQAAAQAGAAPATEATTEPGIQHPLPIVLSTPSTGPLPTLDQSDALLTDVLSRLLGKGSIGMFFNTDRIVRRIVATIDNLSREKLAAKVSIAKPVPDAFVVERRGEDTVMAAANAKRYVQYVQLLDALNTRAVVDEYVRLYPLFQRAYQDLGYPKGYFNDRLIEVIDHLLAAPDAPVPLKLMQPKVRYEYADPQLEASSAGRKIMLRIGPSNAARVKAKLTELRAALVQTPPAPAAKPPQ
jgi:hypothetical protein